MSRLTTRQRRHRTWRRHLQKALALDRVSPLSPQLIMHVDPWGRPCGLGTWAYWFEHHGPERFLVQETLPNGLWVSTIWIGASASWNRAGIPAGWETMVFAAKPPGAPSLDSERYWSRHAALVGHRRMVEEWRDRAPVLIGLP